MVLSRSLTDTKALRDSEVCFVPSASGPLYLNTADSENI